MKKIICLAFLSFNLLANAQGAISLPELAILYRGYQNKIEVGYTGMESCNISVVGGSVSPVNWTDENGFMHSGYNVMVASGTREVSITLTGKDKKGKSVKYGTYKYAVRPLPSPQITTTTISKSSGMVLNVSLPEDCYLSDTFICNSISIGEDYTVSGNTVPASAISNVEVGKKVGVRINVINSRTGMQFDILGIITVIE